MHGPETVGWLLVALCGATSVSCLLRAKGARAAQRQAATSEALMGFGMAAMALPATVVGPVPPVAFAVLFGAAAAWELALAREGRHVRHETAHHLHHAVGALAMVYMALAVASAPGGGAPHHHGGTASMGLPPLTGALLAYFAVYVLHTGVRLMPAGAAAAPAYGTHGTHGTDRAGYPEGARRTDGRGGLAVRDLPGLAVACRAATGAGMLTMLLTL